jgi:hypothetical protein
MVSGFLCAPSGAPLPISAAVAPAVVWHGCLMADTMLFAWIDDVEAILLVFAVMIAFVAIVVVLDLKRRKL